MQFFSVRIGDGPGQAVGVDTLFGVLIYANYDAEERREKADFTACFRD